MTENEKARSIVAATEQATGKAACDDTAISRPKFSTMAVDRQAMIANLLCAGQQNAIPLRDLCGMTGLDGRTVRNMIAAERMKGAPILSDNASGYYLPASAEEKARFIRSMRHRAKEILRAAEAVEKSCKERY